MTLSTHYYVLSLSTKTSSLFEAFRDDLIEVENQGFPVEALRHESTAMDAQHRRELMREVDRCFAHYYACDPLKLVVVGTQEMQAAFSSVTAHRAAIIGRIEGDHCGTRTRDLGQIVWPVVREAMSGVMDQALHDLRTVAGRGHVTSGLEAVARITNQAMGATLLVEDDYHLKGSVWGTDRSPVLSTEVDIRDAIDDAVDAVIEKVLASGGNVVFMPPGTLDDLERIVLLRRG